MFVYFLISLDLGKWYSAMQRIDGTVREQNFRLHKIK